MKRTAQLLAVCLLVATLTGGAVAADQSFLDRLLGLDDDQDPDTTATMLASASGTVERYTMGSALSEPDPEAQLDALARFYNNHSKLFVTYANWQVNATGAHNVINVTYVVDGEQETKFLVLPVEGGRYQSARLQDSLTPPGATSYVRVDSDTYLVHFADGHTETRSTIQPEVDDTIVVRGDAVAAVNGDIKTLITRFVAPQKDVTHAYAAKMASKYHGAIETTLLDGGAQNATA